MVLWWFDIPDVGADVAAATVTQQHAIADVSMDVDMDAM